MPNGLPKKGEKSTLPRGKRQKGVLTGQQIDVINFYFGAAKRNRSKALRMAGYKHPNSSADYFFKMPHIQAEVARREKLIQDATDRALVKAAAKHDISYERAIQELALLAFGRIGDMLDIDRKTGEFLGINLAKATDEQIASLGQVTTETAIEGRGEGAREIRRVTIKPWSKIQALDLLMRHAGLSKEKIKVTGELSLIERINAGRQRVAAEPEAKEGEE